MADNAIEIKGMEELQRRMAQFPNELGKVQDVTMDASLLTLWENVPPYPQRPQESGYTRTGTLGRSLGANMSGGKAGTPSIYTKKKLGSGIEGRFGTNLDYAPFVIGEQQSRYHYMWWTMNTIKEKAQDKIISLWNTAAEKLAKFLDGKGL